MEIELLKRITIIPSLISGKSTIGAKRFPVGDIYEILACGMTSEEIL